MPEYYAPINGSVVDLASGASVGPGETVKLSAKEEEDNNDKIEEGKLLLMEKPKGGDK